MRTSAESAKALVSLLAALKLRAGEPLVTFLQAGRYDGHSPESRATPSCSAALTAMRTR